MEVGETEEEIETDRGRGELELRVLESGPGGVAAEVFHLVIQAGAEVFGERPRAWGSRWALRPREACAEALRAAEATQLVDATRAEIVSGIPLGRLGVAHGVMYNDNVRFNTPFYKTPAMKPRVR